MRLEDFDFDLPEELIALRPARPRPASRLLVAEGDAIADSTVARLGDWLRPGDLLVLNDTRVIPARLTGARVRAGGAGSRIEVTLISGDGGPEWRALARPGKRLAVGDRIGFGGDLSATVLEKEGAEVRLRFDRAGEDFARALEAAGETPLPPYIASRRAPDVADRADYQTVFAARPGAVAAPTAALHFDDALLDALARRGVGQARVTLHVGAGNLSAGQGRGREPAPDARRMGRDRGGGRGGGPGGARRGRAGDPGGHDRAAGAGDRRHGFGRGRALAGGDDIFIRPGYVFQVADGLMTNFHLPKSTLMMLVSALMGVARMRAVYAHAIAARYRFFSYGDSSLLLPTARETR
jgi:S-adenosylmethionine:tRNA ribosyltransferase-isomerase